VTGYSRQNEKDLKLAVIKLLHWLWSCEVIEVKFMSPMLFYRGENPFQQEVREYPGLWIFSWENTR
jgi:hypothetical protein